MEIPAGAAVASVVVQAALRAHPWDMLGGRFQNPGERSNSGKSCSFRRINSPFSTFGAVLSRGIVMEKEQDLLIELQEKVLIRSKIC